MILNIFVSRMECSGGFEFIWNCINIEDWIGLYSRNINGLIVNLLNFLRGFVLCIMRIEDLGVFKMLLYIRLYNFCKCVLYS